MPRTIQKRLDYWTLWLGPQFSAQDRQGVNLRRRYSINQIEYCLNFVFRRSFPIHKIFERSCELGLLRLSADKLSQIFGWPLRKRRRGRLQTVLAKVEHGHHVLRAYSNKATLRMYQKWTTFLRLEVLSNRLKDFGLNKGLENLDAVRHRLRAVTDRFAAFEAEALNTPHRLPRCFSAWPCRFPTVAAAFPGSRFMTRACCVCWKFCCIRGRRSRAGAAVRCTKRSWQPTNSTSHATR